MSHANLLVERRKLLKKGDEICAKAERENRELGADEKESADAAKRQSLGGFGERTLPELQPTADCSGYSRRSFVGASFG